MLLAMDKKGRVYETDSREDGVKGYGRGETNAESGDVFLGDTAKFAEAERMRQWKELAAMRQAEQAKHHAERMAFLKKSQAVAKSKAYIAAQREEMKHNHMGEDPLLEEALSQSRSGADFETMSIVGNPMTADGRCSENLSGFGFSFSDITAGIDSAKNLAASTLSLAQNVIGIKETVAPTATTAFDASAYQQMVQEQVAAQQAAMAKAMATQQATTMLTTQAQQAAAQAQSEKTKKMVIYAGGGLVGLLVLLTVMRKRK